MTPSALRRKLLGAAACAPCAPWLGAAADPVPPNRAALKVLRYAFNVAETGFDPALVQDLYSRIVIAHIFDALYEYDALARPFKIRPNTADGMPQVSADFRTWTVRLQRGIFFADDPAFGGKPRELTAQDYVFSFKRFFDPKLNSPSYSTLAQEGLIGLDALRAEAVAAKTAFDYDREVEGLRALDRYSLQFKLQAPRPRLLYTLAWNSACGAVAREVIEAHAGRTMEHPVGSGPFRLAAWRRSSKLVLERNPGYRRVLYDAQPNADDAEGQALLARFKGRRLPMIDRVEIAIIEESQPRWLSFVNTEFDLLFLLPPEFVDAAVPAGTLAPHLAKRGVRRYVTASADRTFVYFNMTDAVVGGYTPEKVALRRAISLATDVQREIRLARRGQAIAAQSTVAPGTYAYRADYKTSNSDFDPARAQALLDLYGYTDRNGDGWRERPDGTPLLIEYASQPDSLSRQYEELWQRNLGAVGIRMVVNSASWPEQLKRARAGQLMLWQLGYSSQQPDVQDAFEELYGPAAGGQNLSRFKLDAFDALYARMQALPDGPERLAVIADANKLLTAYVPQKFNVHRIVTDLAHPWLVGYRRPTFDNKFWQYIDILEKPT